MQHKYTFDVFGILCRIALACFLVFPLALYIRLKSLLKWVAGIKEGFFVDSCIFLLKNLHLLFFLFIFAATNL